MEQVVNMVNLNNENIMTAKDASKIWGKNPAYVRSMINEYPEKWPTGSWRKFGNTLVVTTKGMEKVTGIKDPRKKGRNSKA